MERRNRSLEALNRLKYIDTLDDEMRASLLFQWNDDYLSSVNIEDFDLDINDLKVLSELFYKNINFMKKHRINMKFEIDNFKKIRNFLD